MTYYSLFIFQSVTNSMASLSTLGNIPMLDGSNFIEWLDMLLLAITYLDLDMALDEPKPTMPTDASSVDERTTYNKWIKANKVVIRIITNSISRTIRGSIEAKENAKDLLEAIKAQFQITDKALGASLISRLTSIKYNGTLGVREHIFTMTNIASKLKEVDMTVSEKYLVQFIFNSLPPEFGPFKVAYNQSSTPWSLNELIAKADQEERRLKSEGQLTVNYVSQNKSKGKGKGKKKVNVQDAKTNRKEKGAQKKCFFLWKEWTF